MLQGETDLEKQGHGEPLGTEGLVEILRGAVHLLRQPDGRAALSFELGFDQPSQMQLRWGNGFLPFHLCVGLLTKSAGAPATDLFLGEY